jgi:Ca2+-binding RTX toxin-like protein
MTVLRLPKQSGGLVSRVLALVGSLALFLVLAAPATALEQRLVSADGLAGDQLGISVAVEGDTAVVGAPADDAGRGAVYVFARVGDSWVQTAKLTASDGATDDLLGGSVALAGETIVAGANGDDVGADANQGSVYTFARTGAAARTETAKLTASDGAADDLLGGSVAVAGQTIVAGAHQDDVGANADQGSASIFFAPAPIAPVGPGPAGPVLEPGACANTKRGTSAAERLRGTSAGDRLFGLGGGDLLSGLAGADCLLGGRGADRLRGGPGADRLSGGVGNDRSSGGPGADRLLGGAGNDRLRGGPGRNRYAAGAGKDTVDARNHRRERVDCGPGRDSASVDRSDRVRRCERIRRT